MIYKDERIIFGIENGLTTGKPELTRLPSGLLAKHVTHESVQYGKLLQPRKQFLGAFGARLVTHFVADLDKPNQLWLPGLYGQQKVIFTNKAELDEGWQQAQGSWIDYTIPIDVLDRETDRLLDQTDELLRLGGVDNFNVPLGVTPRDDDFISPYGSQRHPVTY
jgi:hypothetical protein